MAIKEKKKIQTKAEIAKINEQLEEARIKEDQRLKALAELASEKERHKTAVEMVSNSEKLKVEEKYETKLRATKVIFGTIGFIIILVTLVLISLIFQHIWNNNLIIPVTTRNTTSAYTGTGYYPNGTNASSVWYNQTTTDYTYQLKNGIAKVMIQQYVLSSVVSVFMGFLLGISYLVYHT